VVSDNNNKISIILIPKQISVEEILVTGHLEHIYPQSNILESKIHENSPKEIGEIFGELSGFGLIKRGGYAVDPVMHAFKFEQLNVQFDGGMRVSHACPNRMDPVTTHIASEDLDKIEIIKGPYSVRFGQSLGGIINLVMRKPTQSDSLKFNAHAESYYESNGDNISHRATLLTSYNFYDLFLSAGTKDFGSYKNGKNIEIPSSFRISDYSAKIGLNIATNQRLQFTLRQSFSRDILHVALPMDTREDNTTLWAIDYNARNITNALFSLSAKLYGSRVDHIMDNLERPNYKMVHAVAEVNSQMLGAKFESILNISNTGILYLGSDFYHMNKDGNRNRKVLINSMTGMVMDPPKEFFDPIWQKSELVDYGFFSEWKKIIGKKMSILGGARVDFINSKINKPSEQFIDEYGNLKSKDDITYNLTASMRYQLNNTTSLQLAAGRGMRSPNLTECYINHLSIGQDHYEYFGNPHLKPEVNNQVDVTLTKRIGNINVHANVFYSYLNNYITAKEDTTLPRLFMPTMMPKYTKRFQNIENASQTGFEIGLFGNILSSINYSGNLAYTFGKNIDWNEPLSEIPPLEFKWNLRYTSKVHPIWMEVNGRIVDKQSRYSETFLETETKGFAIFNLLSGYEPFEFLEAVIGVKNIFNKNYYEHLNRRYRNMRTSDILYEPGRNITAQIRIHY
jgi:iron complex outermembrane receptor protein